MKSFIILIAFLFSTHLNALTNPTPKVFAVDRNGHFVDTSAGILTGQAPFQIHVSAIPEQKFGACYWDPTSWRAAGQDNLCQKDRTPPKNNLTAADVSKFFNTDPSKLAHPVDAETNLTPSGVVDYQACFAEYADVDALSKAMEGVVSNCIRAKDIAADNETSTALLGGGSVIKSKYAWDFGDTAGKYNSIDGMNAAHIYDQVGNYPVTLTVTNESGLSGSVKLLVMVTPDQRQLIQVNTDADFATIKAYPPQKLLPIPSGRKILLKAGAKFHFPASIQLWANDWITSDANNMPTVQVVGGALNAYMPGYSDQILAENMNIGMDPAGPAIARGQVFTGSASNIAFRNLRISGPAKGFDSTSSAGILLQNVGNPFDVNGTWVSNKLNSNYIISSSKGVSIFGAYSFFDKADGDGEPGLRFNSGELVNINSSFIGGYAGKNNIVSNRSAKRFTFNNNVVRGGVANVQNGQGGDPVFYAVFGDMQIENNVFENLGFTYSPGLHGLYFYRNIFHMHAASDTAYNLLWPKAAYQLIHGTGGLWFGTGAATSDIYYDSNVLQNDDTTQNIMWIDANISNLGITNNLIYLAGTTASFTPFVMSGTFEAFASPNGITGNTFYIPLTKGVSTAGDNTPALWNAHNNAKNSLLRKDVVMQNIKAPLVNGELPLPGAQITPTPTPTLPPTPSPTPTPTASPTPTATPSTSKHYPVSCNSWNFVETKCLLTNITPVWLSFPTGGWCPSNDSHHPAYKIIQENGAYYIDVTGGCRGVFIVNGN